MFKAVKKDAFDEVQKDDIFDQIQTPNLKTYEAPQRVAVVLNDDVRAAIRQELAALVKSEIAALVKSLKVPPPHIETKTVERIVEKPQVVKELDLNAIEKMVAEKLKAGMEDYSKNWKDIAPIVVPAPIATQDGQSGKVLSTDGRETKWISVASKSSDAYTTSNVTSTKTYDADNTSLDELADVLGSLIASLQGTGIIK